MGECNFSSVPTEFFFNFFCALTTFKWFFLSSCTFLLFSCCDILILEILYRVSFCYDLPQTVDCHKEREGIHYTFYYCHKEREGIHYLLLLSRQYNEDKVLDGVVPGSLP